MRPPGLHERKCRACGETFWAPTFVGTIEQARAYANLLGALIYSTNFRDSPENEVVSLSLSIDPWSRGELVGNPRVHEQDAVQAVLELPGGCVSMFEWLCVYGCENGSFEITLRDDVIATGIQSAEEAARRFIELRHEHRLGLDYERTR